MLEIDSARLVVGLFSAYLGIGLLAGPLAILGFGRRLDRGLVGSSLGFRLLVLPGSVLLWPLLVSRCLRGGGEPPTERNAHRTRSAS